MKSPFAVLALALQLAACGPTPSEAPAASGPVQKPVQLVYNGVIHTVDDARPIASAMAWDARGVLLAVGETEALLQEFPLSVQRDLHGQTVIPGLIDAHAHLSGLAMSLNQADLVGAASKSEVLERLQAQEAKLGEEDWLLGRGWDQNDWPEQVFPDRADLDALFPERPVWLRRIDGHAGWANSAALALADRDLAGEWQPHGGYIHRDASGQASGILIDGAMPLVEALAPPPSAQLMDELLVLAIGEMTRLGLTGVHEAGASPELTEQYLRLIESGRFETRAYVMASGDGEALDWLCARGPIDHVSGRLSMRSVKLYADGALGSRGAALLAEYTDDPGNIGLLFSDPGTLQEQFRRTMACGFQVAVHAIGDRANRAALDAFEALLPEFPDNPGRHRIEHVQILAADDVQRFAQLGIVAAMQPTHATSDMYWAGERLGEERLRYAYAWRSLLDSGGRLALGSDFPVERVNPMLGIYAAVTRQDLQGWPAGGWYPGERLTRAEALRGFTLDAAWAGFMEDRVGSLEVGKQADFVILDRDIMLVPAEEIAETRVLETWLGGDRVYSASP